MTELLCYREDVIIKHCDWFRECIELHFVNPAHLAQYFCNLGKHLQRQHVSKELRLGFITSVLMKLRESVCVYLCVHAYIPMHAHGLFSTLLIKLS